MKRYHVKSGNEELFIKAHSVSWSGTGLQFIRGDEIVALFLTWDFWIEVQVIDETQST